MPVKCQVSVNYSMTPIDCTFSEVPRVGDDVFISEKGGAMMYQVVRVTHWAEDAIEDGPAVSINVSSNPHVQKT